MISKTSHNFDFILVTGEYYDDHPLSPAGMIARVLEYAGFSVGIIEKPLNVHDFTKLGKPRLGFCVTSGSVDSMLNNYTPLKKRRDEDEFSAVTLIPDRAVIFYCNKIKQCYKDSKIIIGGIEASLRRFSHYDYWDNKVRRSILLDSRANILVFGNGEKQMIEIANRLRDNKDLIGILGTCILSKDDFGFTKLPSYSETVADKIQFCKMQTMFSNFKNMAQEYNNNYVIQYKSPEYTSTDLDLYYSLPFTRKLHKNSLLKMAKFSVVTHRGCFGNCNFCAIALSQGDKIISRSIKSILDELKSLTNHLDFKGYIDDLGGPSANMYGMDCATKCSNACLTCKKINLNDSKNIELLKLARKITGIKKIYIRSGVRYDIASPEYIKEIAKYHTSGVLKIAPEHFSKSVLKLMNKDVLGFSSFKEIFESVDAKQGLKYYLMIGHPGETLATIDELKKSILKLKNIDSFQLFTPTPMSISTCMYWTGMNPFTLEKVPVIYDYNTKKKIKRVVLDCIEKVSN
ncbi:YgiQ family radical SAM protein [Candidatus Woesearchaeota archaeon]|nr:YgiQ family radical SAM protein [Candidatus Woesearchaeota archaeon]